MREENSKTDFLNHIQWKGISFSDIVFRKLAKVTLSH